MDKVPPQHAFLDLSDYARPAARWLVDRLPPFVTPIHLTLSFTLVGAAAALLLAVDRYPPLAGFLLLVKSALDAADGSLARARNRPSRVGRFLDSVCDFLVTIMVFCGIAFAHWRVHRDANVWLLAASAILSATLQCTVFSYYYVRYRAQTGGDETSRLRETAEGYAGDNPAVLAILYQLYRVIYGWQDSLMAALDQRLAPNAPVPRGFLTATTLLGLGTQLLVTAASAAVGQPMVALWLFVSLFNLYWAALLMVRFVTRNSTAS
jgi:phosphatidylglycerophosphate synthase